MATIYADLGFDRRESFVAFMAGSRGALQKCWWWIAFACRGLGQVGGDGRIRLSLRCSRFSIYVHCFSVKIALSLGGFRFTMKLSRPFWWMAWAFSASVMLTASADKR